MITASHNPPEYGGIKLWNRNGLAFDTPQQDEIESIIRDRKWKIARWDGIGRVNETDVIEDHAKMILGKVGKASLKVDDVSDIDGIRVDTDNGWILVRPSGTEPRIRITAEARKGVEELYAKAEKLVKGSL
jgi:phosphomannomutase